MNILYTVIGLIVLWSIWGYFSSRVENAKYSVIESKSEYEIRLYPEHIVAQTTVKGTYDEALNQGFRIVAGYIFGGNTKKESIAMTAPVIEKSVTQNSASEKTSVEKNTAEKLQGESIAMTSPVMANIEGDGHTIAFGMPRSYTLETLPVPNDSRIKIVTIPEKKMAVIRFSWFRNTARVQSKKQILIDVLKRNNIKIIGEPQYAGYNAPWTPPWMTRNEVLVEVN